MQHRALARLPGAAILGAALALVACHSDTPPADKAAPGAANSAQGSAAQGGKPASGQAAGAPAAVPVTTIEAKVEKLPVTLEAVGRAEGSRDVEIRARVGGIIEKRLYEEGTAVPAGKVLFQIDRAPYELAVEQAKADLLTAQAHAQLAREEVKRLAPLAGEKAISQREVDTAAANQAEAEAAVAGAQARLKTAQLNLSYTQVTAPIAGLTGRALRSEGSLVNPNDASGLLTTLSQVNPIWVRFSLAQPDYERIRAATRGAQVQLVTNDNTLLAEGGTLNFAGNTVDPQLGTVQLRAEFSNKDRRWLPGQFLKVRVLAGEQDAIRVPQAAIIQADNSRAVMIVTPDNTAAPRPVQATGYVGGDVLVTSGLKAGDRIIVDNLVKVRPGAPVSIKPTDTADAAGAAPGNTPPGGK